MSKLRILFAIPFFALTMALVGCGPEISAPTEDPNYVADPEDSGEESSYAEPGDGDADPADPADPEAPAETPAEAPAEAPAEG